MNRLKAGTHQGDTKELALMKLDCFVASRRLCQGKKAVLERTEGLQATVN